MAKKKSPQLDLFQATESTKESAPQTPEERAAAHAKKLALLFAEASSASTPQARLDEMFDPYWPTLLPLLAKNPNASASLLNRLALTHPREVLQNPSWGLLLLEDNPLQPFSVKSLVALLREAEGSFLLFPASTHESDEVKALVAKHPDCPPEILSELVQQTNPTIQSLAVMHPNFPARMAEALVFHADASLRRCALNCTSTAKLQAILGADLVHALRGVQPQEEVILPLSGEVRAALLPYRQPLAAKLLLWDAQTPETILLQLVVIFFSEWQELLAELEVMALLATHPNCPSSLWPKIFDVKPRAFLYQTKTPNDFTQRAIFQEKDASAYFSHYNKIYGGPHNEDGSVTLGFTREGLHQTSFTQEALRFFAINIATMKFEEEPESHIFGYELLEDILRDPKMGPLLGEIIEQVEPSSLAMGYVLSGVIQNERVPEEVLSQLFVRAMADDKLLVSLAKKTKLPLSVQQKMRQFFSEPQPSYPGERFIILYHLASNPSLDVTMQEWIFAEQSEALFARLLQNPSLDAEILSRLFALALTLAKGELCVACAEHSKLPEALFDALYASRDFAVVSALAQHQKLSPALVEGLLQDERGLLPQELSHLRIALAKNSQLDASCYERLASYHECWPSLADNRSTPTSVLISLAKADKDCMRKIFYRKGLSVSQMLEHNIKLSVFDDDIPF